MRNVPVTLWQVAGVAAGLSLLIPATARPLTAAEGERSSGIPERDLHAEAAALERAGRHAAAAAAYEAILRGDSTHRRILAQRLVKLHAAAGKDDRAMSWATEVMQGHPDPQPYLAGVYALLGQHDQAAMVLLKEIRRSRRPERRVKLHWQLADVYAEAGDSARVRSCLAAALEAAAGTPLAGAAQTRLDELESDVVTDGQVKR